MIMNAWASFDLIGEGGAFAAHGKHGHAKQDLLRHTFDGYTNGKPLYRRRIKGRILVVQIPVRKGVATARLSIFAGDEREEH
jgi:hypothetical protein